MDIRDNGKETGNYPLGFRYRVAVEELNLRDTAKGYKWILGIMEKKLGTTIKGLGFRVAAKKLNSSYYIGESILITIPIISHSGNLTEVP